ncbi:MAG: DMT family protein [Bdellovibrionales bacterium]|nr:DMT family protein [Bdellovibrionales bacterium]
MIKQISPVLLLILANFFMTFAWYGHLKNLRDRPLLYAILSSWAIAFFEYCVQVPANRLGAENYSLPQLKIIQEIITMAVFAGFTVFYMKMPVTRNYAYASICMLGAAWFIFRD